MCVGDARGGCAQLKEGRIVFDLINELRGKRIHVSPCGVKSIWLVTVVSERLALLNNGE